MVKRSPESLVSWFLSSSFGRSGIHCILIRQTHCYLIVFIHISFLWSWSFCKLFSDSMHLMCLKIWLPCLKLSRLQRLWVKGGHEPCTLCWIRKEMSTMSLELLLISERKLACKCVLETLTDSDLLLFLSLFDSRGDPRFSTWWLYLTSFPLVSRFILVISLSIYRPDHSITLIILFRF